MVFQAGVATVNLEPPVGIPMGGYSGRPGPAEGSHDNLQARALVLSHGEERVGIVVCDLVALDPATITAFRELAERGCGIAADKLIVAVTHTHSGPTYGTFLTRYLSTPGAAEEAHAQFAAWGDTLPGKLLAAVQQAEQNLQPAQLVVGRGEATVAVHRRLPDGKGEIRLHPNPDGPINPDVIALKFVSADGAAIATLVNYACHPVVLCEDNLLHSGDFPHYLRKGLEDAGHGVTIFVNGACGDINPKRRGDQAAAAWIGQELAKAASAALANGTPVDPGSLGGASATLDLTVSKLPDPDQIARYLRHARMALDQHANPDNYEGKRLAAEVQRAEQQTYAHQALTNRLRAWGAVDGKIKAQIQALQIGNVMLVGLPGENFRELGATIQAAFPDQTCMVVGYCNRSIGYVPTRQAYLEGGYEVTSSFLVPGSGEEMTEQAINLARGLLA